MPFAMNQSSPGIDDDAAARIRQALPRFVDLLGAEHVLTEGAEFTEFRDPFQPVDWDLHAPSVVLQPGSTDEVQMIVRIAAEVGIPLWTGSQGRNNGYGGSGTRVTGGIVVNLRRMNRILEINDTMGYAVVEPGVSFSQLYEELWKGGHRWLLSSPGIGWGSIIGNTLDHGITFGKYGADHSLACGLEVVTADGELLRTNTGAVPGANTWHLYKRGFGPSLDQLFMQSNFGIVTKMGVWLQPMPEYFMLIQVDADSEAGIVHLVDTIRRLRLDDTIEAVPSGNNTLTAASMVSSRADWFQGEGPIPEEILARIAKDLDIGRWNFRMVTSGDGPIVDHKFAKARAAFLEAPGIRVIGKKVTPEEALSLPHPLDRVMSGHASLDLIKMAGWKGGNSGGHMDFASILPLDGNAVREYAAIFRPMVEEAGLDFKTDLLVISARSALYVSGTNFDVTNADEVTQVHDVLARMVEEAGRRGYGQYRAHLGFMDQSAQQYSYGDHAYRRFVEKIKDAVDPQGILAPGKQGIWPRAYRDENLAPNQS